MNKKIVFATLLATLPINMLKAETFTNMKNVINYNKASDQSGETTDIEIRTPNGKDIFPDEDTDVHETEKTNETLNTDVEKNTDKDDSTSEVDQDVIPVQHQEENTNDIIGERHTKPLVKEIGTLTLTIDIESGSIFLNGERVKSSTTMIKDNVTYIPFKTIVNRIYGGTVSYNKATDYIEADMRGLRLKFKVGSKQGYKNQALTSIELPLIMSDGMAYCPIKSLPSLFNMKMSYSESGKVLTFMAPAQYEADIITSFADFTFDADSYIQGQSVSATDMSYDVSGYSIVDKKWILDGDRNKTSGNLSTLFTNVSPGIHEVGLCVKNSAGKWSEWTKKQIYIEENKRPVVTQITSEEEDYAQGEQIELNYEYTNEEWEAITAEKWYYKRVGEDDKNKVYIKPEYIFYPGDYEVGLQLQDQYGNWSQITTYKLHISDEIKDTELNFKFTRNQAGLIIDNFEKKNYRDFEQVELTKTGSDQGTYILSDSPENVTQNGILYEDYIEGKGRINFHHINSYGTTTKKKKIVVMAENVTNSPVTITLMDKIIKGPSLDALYVGQLLLHQYFRGNGQTAYTLQPGEKMLLINTEDKNWDKDMLIAAQMDLYTSGNVKFTVAALDKGMNEVNIGYLPYLNTDIHPRGTYDTTDLYYEVTAAEGKETYFVVGAGQEEWCVGRDAIKNIEVVNKGNYGIVYHIKIKAEDDMGILLNPRGGAFRGSIRINGVYTYMMPSTSYLSGDGTKAAVVTTVKKGNTVDIEYSLPNGSAAPVLFGMIPKSFWKGGAN